jgi:hypothetical protein
LFRLLIRTLLAVKWSLHTCPIFGEYLSGLYADREVIPAALANNAIGQAVDSLFVAMKMPLDELNQEAICKAALVIQ